MSNETNWRNQWTIPDGVTYLNHGSFGPSPTCVQEARAEWTRRLEREPMDFFIRQMEGHLDEARQKLGAFIGADPANVTFVDNATYGMNVVAASIPLGRGDQVLTTDHEYGAVLRIWRRACRRAGADLVVQKLPLPLTSTQELTERFFEGVSDRTRLIVVSHVASPTSVILPVSQICQKAHERGIPVCIDGPHALAMIPLALDRLGCDFYTASCHKWLCAPFGTGFLYVSKRWQPKLQPPIISWGGSVSGQAPDWKDEFNWLGTRDPAGFLTVPAAIEFLQQAGIEEFRRVTHRLAAYAHERIADLTGIPPLLPDSPDWYGSMVTVPIPTAPEGPSDARRRDPLQDRLWEQQRIEVPIVRWQNQRFVRVSCHLYNSRDDIDRLVDGLSEHLSFNARLEGD